MQNLGREICLSLDPNRDSPLSVSSRAGSFSPRGKLQRSKVRRKARSFIHSHDIGPVFHTGELARTDTQSLNAAVDRN